MDGDRTVAACSDTKKQKLNHLVDKRLKSNLAYDVLTEGEERLVWLLTFASSSSSEDLHSCFDLYFVRQDGSMFKAKYKFKPYFYVASKDKTEDKVAAYLRTEYHGQFADIQLVKKEDFDPKSDSSGLLKSYLKISFDTVQQLMQVKSDLMHLVKRNQYESGLAARNSTEPFEDSSDCIDHLKEYDEPSHVRFAIDNDIRSGWWYDVIVSSDGVTLNRNLSKRMCNNVHVCAFDIKTTNDDSIKVISCIVNDHGYLIINKQCVEKNINDLKYSLKQKFSPSTPYEVQFTVWNEINEEAVIKSWFSHMRDLKPGVYVTYKDNSSNWLMLENKAAHYGLVMKDELGFECEETEGVRFPCRLDCFSWVKRDVTLFHGRDDLKDATEFLHYIPVEVTPEKMASLAVTPQPTAESSERDTIVHRTCH